MKVPTRTRVMQITPRPSENWNIPFFDDDQDDDANFGIGILTPAVHCTTAVCVQVHQPIQHFFLDFQYQDGVKSTVSGVFEDLKFKISEGQDQN